MTCGWGAGLIKHHTFLLSGEGAPAKEHLPSKEQKLDSDLDSDSGEEQEDQQDSGSDRDTHFNPDSSPKLPACESSRGTDREGTTDKLSI